MLSIYLPQMNLEDYLVLLKACGCLLHPLKIDALFLAFLVDDHTPPIVPAFLDRDYEAL